MSFDFSNFKKIPKEFFTLAENATQIRTRKINELLKSQKIPKEGFSESLVLEFLMKISSLDSNNFEECVGLGEREGRIFSEIVKKSHFFFSHGIGRSGDILAAQPKACGSSVLNCLSQSFAIHALKLCGVSRTKNAVVLPCATGLGMLLMTRAISLKEKDKKIVIWSRLDQKSVLKALILGGFDVKVCELVQNGDALETDLVQLENLIKFYGKDQILCVVSSTSTFAPRAPDKILEIGQICKKYEIFHLVNNAYGLQCTKITQILNDCFDEARNSRVDGFVQSTDKNFLCPVGGCVVAGDVAPLVSSSYPGRASLSPIRDFVVTMAEMGQNGLKNLIRKRKELFAKFKGEILEKICTPFGLKLLHVPDNRISLALAFPKAIFGENFDLEKFGGVVFSRKITGVRVVKFSEKITTIGNFLNMQNFNAHRNLSKNEEFLGYVNLAIAIGCEENETQKFIRKFSKVLSNFLKREQGNGGRETL